MFGEYVWDSGWERPSSGAAQWIIINVNEEKNYDFKYEYEAEKSFICAKSDLQFTLCVTVNRWIELFCSIHSNLCVVQGNTSRMLIGAGERRDGLYYCCNVPSAKVFKTNGIGSLDLWHEIWAIRLKDSQVSP